MNRPTDELLDKANEQLRYRASFDDIVLRVVTPENIDSYADAALTDLINVIGSILSDYISEHTDSSTTLLEQERAALRYFQLDPALIEQTLDHVSDVAMTIDSLDGLIERQIVGTGSVIVPPVAISPEIAGRGGTLERRKILSKLKTLLLVVQAEFNINLETDIHIKKGLVPERSFRQEPYYSLEIPALNRTVLVCDEVGNRTFIFDREQLRILGIEHVEDLTKIQLDELIEQHPYAGRGVVNRGQASMEQIVTYMSTFGDSDVDPAVTRLLHKTILESMPENHTTVAELMAKLGVSREAIRKATDALGEELGQLHRARVTDQPGPAVRIFSPEQRQLIEQWLDEHNMLGGERPDGLSNPQIAKFVMQKLDLSRRPSIETIKRAVSNLTEQLDEPVVVGRGNSMTTGRTTDDAEKISVWLRDNLYNHSEMPEGYMTKRAFALLHRTSPTVVEQAIDVKREGLGDLQIFRAPNGKPDICLNPEQQEIILGWLDEEGYVYPDGYLSARQAITEIGGTDKKWVRKTAESLKSKGDISDDDVWLRRRTLTNQTLVRYSPAVVALLRQLRQDSLAFRSESTYEGFHTIHRTAITHGETFRNVALAVDALRDSMGEIKSVANGEGRSVILSPDQQRQAIDWIGRNIKKRQ